MRQRIATRAGIAALIEFDAKSAKNAKFAKQRFRLGPSPASSHETQLSSFEIFAAFASFALN